MPEPPKKWQLRNTDNVCTAVFSVKDPQTLQCGSRSESISIWIRFHIWIQIQGVKTKKRQIYTDTGTVRYLINLSQAWGKSQ